MEDLAKSPLVREQKTFEKRLAAAVIVQASEDFMLFEESVVKDDKFSRHRAKVRAGAIKAAEKFFDGGSKMFDSWWLVLHAKVDVPAFKKGYRDYLYEKKQRLYEAELNRRAGAGALSKYPAWVAVEAYRRVVEAGWVAFYVRACEKAGQRARKLTASERAQMQSAYRNTLKSEDAEGEAMDIMFEYRNGLIGEAA